MASSASCRLIDAARRLPTRTNIVLLSVDDIALLLMGSVNTHTAQPDFSPFYSS
jgi:hypothetical protein